MKTEDARALRSSPLLQTGAKKRKASTAGLFDSRVFVDFNRLLYIRAGQNTHVYCRAYSPFH